VIVNPFNSVTRLPIQLIAQLVAQVQQQLTRMIWIFNYGSGETGRHLLGRSHGFFFCGDFFAALFDGLAHFL
jgi:hypothetical protein